MAAHEGVPAMQITCLPILRYDETLYSVAARIRFRNAARDDRDACRTLFGPSSNIRVVEYPVNLDHFSDVTGGNFGDARKVLAETTLFEFFERLGGSPWRAAKWRRPVETAGYGLATLSNGHINTWRACSRCVEADLSRYATSYWRRAHQLPATYFCLDHHIPLSCSTAPEHDRHIRFLLPEQTTFTVVDLIQHEDVLIRLSRLAGDVLFHVGEVTDFSSSCAAILRALDSWGLLTAEGGIRAEELAIEFSHQYAFLRHYPEFRDALSSEGIGILCRSLEREGSWRRRPQHSLLLIDWLFGSWRSFQEQCLWQSIMDSPGLQQTRNKSEASSNDRWAHREVCNKFLSTSKSPRRREFFLVARRSYQWLLSNDTEWFELNFPDARCSASQGELF
jgi:hypothetical protein